MNKKLILVGGGGHCKSVLDTLLENNEYDDIAIVDKKENISKKILGIKIIACDDDLDYLFKKGYKNAFVSLGSIGNPKIRIKLFEKIKSIGYNLPNIVDKSAIVSKNSVLKNGIFIGKNTVINTSSIIQDCCIINTSSIIEHDCSIGKFVHIASSCTLGGNVSIGDNCHIGSNSTIRNNLSIGKNTIVGIGSVVTKNIPDNIIAYGNPAKIHNN